MGKSNDISGDLPVDAFFGIVNAEVFIWDAAQDALRESGVQVGVGRLIPLMSLAARPMRLQELSSCTRAKQSAASRLVERMVKDGLVMKERDGDDGRAVLLRITDEGRRVEEAGRAVFADCLRDLFAALDEDEMRTLCSLLMRLELPKAEAVS